MSQLSTIEWTDSTWNPGTGCTKVSPGCKNCYAKAFAERFRGVPGHPYEQGFDLKLWPERLTLPLKWRKPRLIFVNSMSDLFHEGVPDEFISQVFEVMRKANWHTFQVLTKRSERMLAWTGERYCPADERMPGKQLWPPNVWIGVSVESQEYTWRIRNLVRAPARVRFLSLEPLLGPIELPIELMRGIHWVIVGGESGHGARPMQPEWALSLLRQCQNLGVPFFFKQWGAHNSEGKRVGKKSAGRVLVGRTWDDMPGRREVSQDA